MRGRRGYDGAQIVKSLDIADDANADMERS